MLFTCRIFLVFFSWTLLGFRYGTCAIEIRRILEFWMLWPRGQRRGYAGARLLGLWVRIPPWTWVSVSLSVVYCQVEVSATGWSLIQRIPTECGVSECDREASTLRKPWPTMDCYAIQRKDSRVITQVGYIAICRWQSLFFTAVRYSNYSFTF